MVGVDFSLWIVLCIERGADFDFCVQRAGVVLENIFPYDAHRLGCGAQKRGVRCKLRKLLACYPKTFHIFALNKYL